MSKYEYENIATPDECVRLTFDDVLGRTTISMEQHNKSIEELNTHGNRYQTAYFLRGPHSGIRTLVLQSLQQNATARGGFAVPELLPRRHRVHLLCTSNHEQFIRARLRMGPRGVQRLASRQSVLHDGLPKTLGCPVSFAPK